MYLHTCMYYIHGYAIICRCAPERYKYATVYLYLGLHTRTYYICLWFNRYIRCPNGTQLRLRRSDEKI